MSYEYRPPKYESLTSSDRRYSGNGLKFTSSSVIVRLPSGFSNDFELKSDEFQQKYDFSDILENAEKDPELKDLIKNTSFKELRDILHKLAFEHYYKKTEKIQEQISQKHNEKIQKILDSVESMFRRILIDAADEYVDAMKNAEDDLLKLFKEQLKK